jgi:hypothetical protein
MAAFREGIPYRDNNLSPGDNEQNDKNTQRIDDMLHVSNFKRFKWHGHNDFIPPLFVVVALLWVGIHSHNTPSQAWCTGSLCISAVLVGVVLHLHAKTIDGMYTFGPDMANMLDKASTMKGGWGLWAKGGWESCAKPIVLFCATGMNMGFQLDATSNWIYISCYMALMFGITKFGYPRQHTMVTYYMMVVPAVALSLWYAWVAAYCSPDDIVTIGIARDWKEACKSHTNIASFHVARSVAVGVLVMNLMSFMVCSSNHDKKVRWFNKEVDNSFKEEYSGPRYWIPPCILTFVMCIGLFNLPLTPAGSAQICNPNNPICASMMSAVLHKRMSPEAMRLCDEQVHTQVSLMHQKGVLSNATRFNGFPELVEVFVHLGTSLGDVWQDRERVFFTMRNPDLTSSAQYRVFLAAYFAGNTHVLKACEGIDKECAKHFHTTVPPSELAFMSWVQGANDVYLSYKAWGF